MGGLWADDNLEAMGGPWADDLETMGGPWSDDLETTLLTVTNFLFAALDPHCTVLVLTVAMFPNKPINCFSITVESRNKSENLI